MPLAEKCPVPVIMECSTGKAVDCDVEFHSPDEASEALFYANPTMTLATVRAWAVGRSMLGGRDIGVPPSLWVTVYRFNDRIQPVTTSGTTATYQGVLG